MAERNRLILWTLAAILLIIVFFAVRRLTREELPLRVAQATMQDLITTDSTNGKVEPQHNFEAHAPAPGTVKTSMYGLESRSPRASFLLSLDDGDAVAHSASALAALRGAAGKLPGRDEQGGTQEERNRSPANMAKAQMDRDQAQRDLDALKKLVAQGAAAPSEVTSAQQRLDARQHLPLDPRKEADCPLFSRGHRPFQGGSGAGPGSLLRRQHRGRRLQRAGAVCTAPSIPCRFRYRSTFSPGALLLQMADLTKLQVRAYFDEPELGALHVGQPATIVWDALPNRMWHGRILSMPSTIINFKHSKRWRGAPECG